MSFSYKNNITPGPEGIMGPSFAHVVLKVAKNNKRRFPLLSSLDPYGDREFKEKELALLLDEISRMVPLVKDKGQTLYIKAEEREAVLAYLSRLRTKVEWAIAQPGAVIEFEGD